MAIIGQAVKSLGRVAPQFKAIPSVALSTASGDLQGVVVKPATKNLDTIMSRAASLPTTWADPPPTVFGSHYRLLSHANYSMTNIMATELIVRGDPEIDRNSIEPMRQTYYNRAQIAQAVTKALGLQVVKRSEDCAAWVVKETENNYTQGVKTDHLAGRTLDRTQLHNTLDALGYEAQEVFEFKKLGLYGGGYQHKDFPQTLPLFFLSNWDAKLAGADEVIAGNIKHYLQTSVFAEKGELEYLQTALKERGKLDLRGASRLVELTAKAFTNHIPKIDEQLYEKIVADGYDTLGWILTNGQQINHLAVSSNDLPADIAAVQDLIPDAKALPQQNSESGLLSQTALVARPFPYTFSNGRVRMVPGAFLEFAQRRGNPPYLGFNIGNATAIFNFTTAVQDRK